jgi:hypothetical protein
VIVATPNATASSPKMMRDKREGVVTLLSLNINNVLIRSLIP